MPNFTVGASNKPGSEGAAVEASSAADDEALFASASARASAAKARGSSAEAAPVFGSRRRGSAASAERAGMKSSVASA
ncbi:MAG TPA: hypothetical protein PLV92_01000 [Pirellulaceae bacterium]|nr:hypothetical protein [Pirellulaceae bacterium]